MQSFYCSNTLLFYVPSCCIVSLSPFANLGGGVGAVRPSNSMYVYSSILHPCSSPPPPLGLTTLWTVNHPEGWVPYITVLYMNKQSVQS